MTAYENGDRQRQPRPSAPLLHRSPFSHVSLSPLPTSFGLSTLRANSRQFPPKCRGTRDESTIETQEKTTLSGKSLKLYSPFIRSKRIPLIARILLRSARNCGTWVIPLHFSLTTRTPWNTIFSPPHLTEHFGRAVPLPAWICGSSSWPRLTRTRVFQMEERRRSLLCLRLRPRLRRRISNASTTNCRNVFSELQMLSPQRRMI